MEYEPQFQVNQILQLIHEQVDKRTGRTKWHVVEVQTQQCPAGTQIWYTCRGHMRDRYTGNLAVTTSLIKFNEVELEEYQNTAPRKKQIFETLTDDELKDAVAMLKEVAEARAASRKPPE